MADISVIGSGSWGTALAWLLRNNGHRVTLWSYLREENEMFLKYRENVDKLPGVLLDQEVVFTNRLEESIPGRDMLVAGDSQYGPQYAGVGIRRTAYRECG